MHWGIKDDRVVWLEHNYHSQKYLKRENDNESQSFTTSLQTFALVFYPTKIEKRLYLYFFRFKNFILKPLQWLQ